MTSKNSFSFSRIFLITILLFAFTLPNVSALSTGRIVSAKITNSNGFDGIASDNDQLTFQVTAKIDGDADLTRNVVAYDQNAQPVGFFSCIAGEPQTCTLKYPETGKRRITGKAPKYSVLLVDDSGYVVDRKDISIIVDNRAPQITLFEIGGTTDYEGKKISSNGNVYLNFDVADYGYNGDKNICTGVSLVEFFLGKAADNKKIAECSEDCLAESSCSITGKSVAYSHTETGDVTICARAKDKLEKISPEICKIFFVDKTAPIIKKETARLTDNNNKPITNILPGKSLSAKFSLGIEGVDIDTQNVLADFSELNPNLKSVKPSSNSRNGNVLTFVWDLDLSPQSEGTKKVLITAKDIFGNQIDAANSQVDITLGKDDAGPVIKSIQSQTPSPDGKIYISQNAVILSTIEDATGINSNDIILHVGQKTFSANECTGDKIYTCKWSGLNPGDVLEDEYSISIGADSKDILGNVVKEPLEVKGILDRTIPELKQGPTIMAKTEDGGVPVIKTGDILLVQAILTESNSLFAYADFSSVIIGASKLPIPCEFDEQKSQWLCSVETPKIDRTGVINNANIKITFSDGAGNKIEKTEKISVMTTKDAPQGGQLFELVVLEKLISNIDASVLVSMAKQDYSVVVPIQLNDKAGCAEGAEIVNPVLKCDEISKKDIYLPVSRPYTGFAEFYITTQNIAGKEALSIGATNACFVQYNVKCGNTVYKTPEQQPLRVNIFIKWDSLTATQGIEHDIKIIKDDVNGGLLSTMNTIDRAGNFAQNICKIRSGFQATIQVVSYVGEIFAVCRDSTGGFWCSGEEATLTNIMRQQTDAYDKISGYLDTACGFISCQGKEGKFPGSGKVMGVGKAPLCDLYRDALLGANSGLLGKKLEFLPNIANIEYKDADGKTVTEKPTLGTVYAGLSQSNLEFAKKNWFFAAGCMCLPGLAANIQSYRQIKCEKAVCLADVVPPGMQTPDDCNKEYAINNCKYFSGATYGGLFDMVLAPLKAVANAFENPVASAWVIGRKVFQKVCSKQTAGGASVKWTGSCIPYSLAVTIETFAHSVDFWSSFKDSLKGRPTTLPGKQDYCEILDKIEIGSDDSTPAPAQQTPALQAPQANPAQPAQA